MLDLEFNYVISDADDSTRSDILHFTFLSNGWLKNLLSLRQVKEKIERLGFDVPNDITGASTKLNVLLSQVLYNETVKRNGNVILSGYGWGEVIAICIAAHLSIPRIVEVLDSLQKSALRVPLSSIKLLVKNLEKEVLQHLIDSNLPDEKELELAISFSRFYHVVIGTRTSIFSITTALQKFPEVGFSIADSPTLPFYSSFFSPFEFVKQTLSTLKIHRPILSFSDKAYILTEDGFVKYINELFTKNIEIGETLNKQRYASFSALVELPYFTPHEKAKLRVNELFIPEKLPKKSLNFTLVQIEGGDLYVDIPSDHWMLQEHKLRGTSLLVCTVIFELVSRIVQEKISLKTGAAINIEKIQILSPLFCRGNIRISIRIVEMDGKIGIILSHEEKQIFDCILELDKHHVPNPSPFPHAAYLGVENEVLEGPGVVSVGPRWSSKVWRKKFENWFIAEMILPKEFLKDLDEMSLHPALLDIGVNVGLNDVNDRGYIPYSYSKVTISGRFERRSLSYSRKKNSPSPAELCFEVYIVNSTGELILYIGEYKLRKSQFT